MVLNTFSMAQEWNPVNFVKNGNAVKDPYLSFRTATQEELRNGFPAQIPVINAGQRIADFEGEGKNLPEIAIRGLL